MSRFFVPSTVTDAHFTKCGEVIRWVSGSTSYTSSGVPNWEGDVLIGDGGVKTPIGGVEIDLRTSDAEKMPANPITTLHIDFSTGTQDWIIRRDAQRTVDDGDITILGLVESGSV